MKIAKFSIQHKVTTILVSVMLVLFGILYGSQLSLALMPEMEAPMAVVMTTYAGANPGDMEELITDPLESAIMSVPGVEKIHSQSAENVSTIQITYQEDTDTDIAATRLREKFDMVPLPEDASKPMIVNMNLSQIMPTAMIALLGEDQAQLQLLAEEVVCPALERLDGVAQVTVSGGLERQIVVELNASRCAALGISNSYVAQNLTGQNLLYPGGDLENGTETLTVTTDAKFQSVDDVANTILTLPTGGSIRLSEVADVRMEAMDPDAIAQVQGSPCVMLQVSKQSSANEMKVAQAVAKRLAELNEDHAQVDYFIPYIASDYIAQVTRGAFQNIFQGILLAAVVVFLFLRRGSSTFTIAVSMPVCILAVFIIMYLLDLTMNMLSLGGIAMGVGMIVDNSIVVLENINRFFAEGKSRIESCVEGTQEVASSVVASTLTTMAVFVPLALSGGMAGMLFRDFCLTITTLIAASLAISLTLVPLLCYFTLNEETALRRREKLAKKTPSPVKRRLTGLVDTLRSAYLRLLGYLLRHLKLGMLISVALVVLFAATIVNTKMVLIPAMDQGTVSIDISLPVGSEVEQSAAIAQKVAAAVEEHVPETRDMYYLAEGQSVTFGVNLVDRAERTRSSFDVEDALRPILNDIPGCKISVSASGSMAGFSGSDISVHITGDDYAMLSLLADDLTRQISALPDAIEVENSLSQQVTQVRVRMNRDTAAQYGLTAASVGSAVRAELTGVTATAVTIDNQEYNVMVKGDGSTASSLDALKSMPVPTPVGGSVPLSSVANVTLEEAPQTISRDNQHRQVTITGSTLSGDTAAITKQINAILDGFAMPQGYTAETAGGYEDMIENFSDLLLALAGALLLVYFVLAVQFESFAMPVIVMMILPVAFLGALFALPVTGRDLSMLSLVALIMLAGTVVNASILLVEYIKVRRRMGESREEAILQACPLRIRPILMTTLTTVLAMLPMALGWGQANEMLSDMGIVMISGMVISTLITLIFTPVYYSVIDQLSHSFSRRKKQSRPAASEAQ